jgi:Ca-activated chloride channel family protein
MIHAIHWAATEYSIFLPVILLFVGAVVLRSTTRIKLISGLLSVTAQKRWLTGFTRPREVARGNLWTIALCCMAVALMRPQWGSREQIIPQEGRDLLILLDISRSMRSADVVPNRLDAAKLKIKALLRKLSCERVGLILFSGSAFVQCPLTRDFSSVEMFLDHVDIETIASGTTAIDSAIRMGLDVFARTAERKHKLMLVVTDGEDFSTRFDDVAHKAAEQGALICALGVGSEAGAPIPTFRPNGSQAGVERDEKGNIILSRLNEPLLQEITKKLQGTYVRLRPDNSDLDQLVAFFETVEKEQFEDQKLQQFEDQYPWFLACSLGCLLLEWLL